MQYAHERRQSPRLHCFTAQKENAGYVPVWLFSENTSSTVPAILLDISQHGCSLLLDKGSQLPTEAEMTIFGEDGGILGIVRCAMQATWDDHQYSVVHKKTGVQWLPFGDKDRTRLQRVLDKLGNGRATFVRCIIDRMKGAPAT